jgi:hypothetical protein
MTKTKQEFDKLLHKSRKWCKVYIGFSSFEYCKEIKKYENILTYILSLCHHIYKINFIRNLLRQPT